MGLAKNVIIIERGLWATIARGIFGAGSGFRVGWGIAGAGGVGFCLSAVFLLVLAEFLFWWVEWRWAIILWGLDTFLMFPNFLSLN